MLLTLNYYECPMLCPIILGNLAHTMGKMSGLTPGKDFKLLTVSINSEGSLKNASDRANETYKMVARFGDARPWWPFLLGTEPTIRALTDAVGFHYKKLGKDNFAHPSVLVVLSPGGKVSRYLYGIEQEPRDLRLALTEAAEGKIGASATLNRLFLFCYHYDPVGKKYQLLALNVAKVIGGFVLVSLGILFGTPMACGTPEKDRCLKSRFLTAPRRTLPRKSIPYSYSYWSSRRSFSSRLRAR